MDRAAPQRRAEVLEQEVRLGRTDHAHIDHIRLRRQDDPCGPIGDVRPRRGRHTREINGAVRAHRRGGRGRSERAAHRHVTHPADEPHDRWWVRLIRSSRRFIQTAPSMSVGGCGSRPPKHLAATCSSGVASRLSRCWRSIVLRLADFDLCKGCEVCSDPLFPVARVSYSCSGM